MRYLLACLLICSLLLPACRGNVPEATQLWQQGLPGAVQYGAGNELLYYDGLSFRDLDAAGQLHGTTAAAPAGAGATRNFSQMLFAITCTAPMYEGPEGIYLFNSFGKYQLASHENPAEPVTLETPLPDELASTGLLRGHRGMMCFLGESCVVLHNYQLAAAYDLRGRLLWQFMWQGNSALHPSPAADRLALATHSGSVWCLAADGRLLWQRAGSYITTSLGDRLLLADQLSGSLLCLDWDGNTLWQQELPGVVQELAGNAVCGRALLNPAGQLLCLDAEGSVLWRHNAALEGHSTLLLADDGYAFQLYEHYGSRGGILGGRVNARSDRQASWTCFDPAGRPSWVFRDVPDFADGPVAGHAGRLFMSDLNTRELSCYGLPGH